MKRAGQHESSHTVQQLNCTTQAVSGPSMPGSGGGTPRLHVHSRRRNVAASTHHVVSQLSEVADWKIKGGGGVGVALGTPPGVSELVGVREGVRVPEGVLVEDTVLLPLRVEEPLTDTVAEDEGSAPAEMVAVGVTDGCGQ